MIGPSGVYGINVPVDLVLLLAFPVSDRPFPLGCKDLGGGLGAGGGLPLESRELELELRVSESAWRASGLSFGKSPYSSRPQC